jgi:hypothetical protein
MSQKRKRLYKRFPARKFAKSMTTNFRITYTNLQRHNFRSVDKDDPGFRKDTETFIIRQIQCEAFEKEIENLKVQKPIQKDRAILKLDPFIDNEAPKLNKMSQKRKRLYKRFPARKFAKSMTTNFRITYTNFQRHNFRTDFLVIIWLSSSPDMTLVNSWNTGPTWILSQKSNDSDENCYLLISPNDDKEIRSEIVYLKISISDPKIGF